MLLDVCVKTGFSHKDAMQTLSEASDGATCTLHGAMTQSISQVGAQVALHPLLAERVRDGQADRQNRSSLSSAKLQDRCGQLGSRVLGDRTTA